jgi:23S rRNA (uridine2552-2'-O)-methyltransferase
MAYTVRDRFFLKAKKEHYLARAIYKLEEIQKKHRILRAGDRVLDLGAAPGSWIQLTSGVVGRSGLVVGIDLKQIDHKFENRVVTIQGDIFDHEFVEAALRGYLPFDVVLSDMAPATSGIKVADSARSALLFERAFELARWALRPGGTFLAKIFHGSEFHQLLAEVKKEFARTRVIRPEATRKQSREIYILGMNLRGLQDDTGGPER